MSHGQRWMDEAYKYIEVRGCTTIASAAKALGVEWERARYVIALLKKEGRLVEVEYGGKVLWCVSEEAAEEAVNALRAEVWRVICANRLRYVSPSKLARLISEDPKALRTLHKFAAPADLTAVGGLKILDAALRDLFGREFGRRTRRKLYYVPEGFCREPPPRVRPKVYKPPHSTIVTFWVPEAMARDIERAAAELGVSKPLLVRMAIERMLQQYRHLLRRQA